MTTIKKLLLPTVAAGILGSPSLLSAATITFQSSVDLFADGNVETFVNTTGTLAVAANAGTDLTSSPTVNGVTFVGGNNTQAVVGAGGETISFNSTGNNTGAFGDGEFSGITPIFDLLTGGVFGTTSVELSGLTIGQDYLIQIFTNDARASRDNNFITGFGDGTGSTTPVAFSDLSNVDPDPNVGGSGDSIIGTFTADSTTLSINVFGTNAGPGGTFTAANSEAQINGIQLRAVPEPSSALLLGIGSFALLLRRRK